LPSRAPLVDLPLPSQSQSTTMFSILCMWLQAAAHGTLRTASRTLVHSFSPHADRLWRLLSESYTKVLDGHPRVPPFRA
jgi:hypothetical protein